MAVVGERIRTALMGDLSPGDEFTIPNLGRGVVQRHDLDGGLTFVTLVGQGGTETMIEFGVPVLRGAA